MVGGWCRRWLVVAGVDDDYVWDLSRLQLLDAVAEAGEPEEPREVGRGVAEPGGGSGLAGES